MKIRPLRTTEEGGELNVPVCPVEEFLRKREESAKGVEAAEESAPHSDKIIAEEL